MEPKTYIVGDVHGCLQELQLLLQQMDLHPTTTVIFAGDLVDKGPDSAGVVQCVRLLRNRVRVVLVKGNHEEKHERHRRHEARIAVEGGENPIKDADTLRKIGASLSVEDVAFLEGAVLWHRIDDHGLVVHAGVPQWLKELPDTDHRFLPRKYAEILRLRAFDSRGRFMVLDQYQQLSPQDREASLWANAYDGRFGHVYFGHQPFGLEPRRFPHATGLDTGCCYGGRLTAVEVTSGEVLQVQALDTYATSAFDD